MKEIVNNSFESVLPIKLKNMMSSNRDDARNAIQSRSQFLVNHVICKEFSHESEVEIIEFNTTHCACQSKASSKQKRSLLRNALKISRNLKPTQISDLSEDSLWSDFLCTIIVKLWLLLLNLTAQECREQFLSSARHLIGYGAVSFYPSAVRINILTLQEEIELKGRAGAAQIDLEHVGSDDGTSKIPIWTTLQTEYSCNTRSGQAWNSHNLTQVTTTIHVQINSQEVLVTEHSNTRTIMSEQFNLQKSRGSTSDVKSKKVLFKIMIDEIISWGYNENKIILKFRQRHPGHEASYYSDDDDINSSDEEDQAGYQVHKSSWLSRFKFIMRR
jgi:hypothetical protein